MVPSDQQLLQQIESLLNDIHYPQPLELNFADKPQSEKRDRKLLQTDLALIIPSGASAAYSVNASGYVDGLKFSSVPNAGHVLRLICQFSQLKSLVFYSSQEYEVPSDIQALKKLQFVCFGDGLKKLPPELLALNLPVFAEAYSGDSLQDYERSEPVRRLLSVESELNEIGRRYRKPVEGRDETALLAEIRRIQEEFEPELRERRAALRGVFLTTATLEDPPLEIAAKGREAIATYFRERGTGMLPINELKVILVGNGAAGKTSLVKCVFGDAFDPKEPTTHGINIRSWGADALDSKKVKLNFWDFGGQEIMHATHQFFLSKRSMYILVLDGRKDEDPEYWLQHIESFGGDSPVMIVLNKIDDNPSFDVNRRFLQDKYKGIVNFFRVSCAKGIGIDNFKSSLVEELRRVPMIQTLWPSAWFRVKQRLEDHHSAYVSLKEYRAICEEEKVTEASSQETLVDFLNDLGVMLHFKDVHLLDTHVLDPRWVTEAVYRIITSELLAEQKGVLRLTQLSEALTPKLPGAIPYPADKHQYIIDLMLKFELCYELDKKSILVPDLLDVQQPETNFDEHGKDVLRFVFQYGYLPKSIMPRFIVRMNRDIKKDKRWRTGVVLEDDTFGATALVRADSKAKKIEAFVTGKQKRDYFATARKVLKDINSSFEKLDVTELVPLPDVPNFLLDYQELLGYERASRGEYFVGKLGKGYSVQELLDGIERKAVRDSLPSPVVVQGHYFQNATGARIQIDSSQNTVNGGHMSYQPHNWEKVILYVTGFLFIGLVGFLLIRNQPIVDKNLVVALRIILSIVVAAFAAAVPGMLKVDMSFKGIAIRAAGALAVFVIAFMLTPKVL